MPKDESPNRIDDPYWETLKSHHFDQQSRYDSAVLTLNSGAIAISATLVATLFSPVVYKWLFIPLLLAWLLWTLGIAASLFSYRWAAKNSLRYMERGSIENRKEDNNIIEWINIASGVFLAIGIACFALFIGFSIYYIDMNKEKHNPVVTTCEGTPVPPPKPPQEPSPVIIKAFNEKTCPNKAVPLDANGKKEH